MEKGFHEEKEFQNINFSEQKLSGGEFIRCGFKNCNFEKSDLANNEFEDCVFTACNFSNAKLDNTGLREVKFIDCKLLGLDFSACNSFLFGVGFENCVLDYAIFSEKKIKKTSFVGCSLKQADFSAADLTAAVFKNCDLAGAAFDQTVLEKTDFRSAANYSFDPEKNKMKRARFSASGLAGLLSKFNLDIDNG